MLPLGTIFPKITHATIMRYGEPLQRIMLEYDINTPLRQAHFLGQIAHESGEFRYVTENMNYSASRLLQVFPRYFTRLSDAQHAAGNPERIANTVYASRMGNGDTNSGDGFRFIGRGLIQLTGRNNYTAYVNHLRSLPTSRLDAETQVILRGGTPSHPYPDSAAAIAPLLAFPEHAVRSACWYWQRHGLNQKADKGDSDQIITQITRAINGGTNGLSQRKAYTLRCLAVLVKAATH